MLSKVIYEDKQVKWVVFARDPEKPNNVIDTNEYLIISDGKGMVLDPGGMEIFPDVVAAMSDYIPIEDITVLFGSHQDPDIISSLSLWNEVCPKAQVYVPWVWTSFIAHFGYDAKRMIAVPDEGMKVQLSANHVVDLVPAHYLHSSGNLHVYDPRAKFLFSGDVGAALLPPEKDALYVEDFAQHTKYMEKFHMRWMPSNAARDAWLQRVRKMKIDQMLPQHGSIFKDDDVTKFFDWFSKLELGAATKHNAA